MKHPEKLYFAPPSWIDLPFLMQSSTVAEAKGAGARVAWSAPTML